MPIQEDMGSDGNTQCPNHPFNNTTAHGGGICAFCLQEKLGKLVSSTSSSYPVTVFPSSSSSSSPSFRSDFSPAVIVNRQNSAGAKSGNDSHYHRRSRIPFLLTHKKKKKKDVDHSNNSIIFQRSKSTAIHRTPGGHFLGSDYGDDFRPQKHRFWSFLYFSNNSSSTTKTQNPNFSKPTFSGDRKVSRSRSVGCGSRSFSGDFFDRISTGFGDCTLRRVESQREGKSRVAGDRVKCGGLFSGFTITSSSSSSSSSSYWVSSSAEDNLNGRGVPAPAAGNLAHGRSRSWGWALASPIRAFSRPLCKREKSVPNKIDNNSARNLAAIPSFLSVRS
ncbi:hypothetical protein LguiA_031212 [Lonicera macranthoides]